MLQKSPLRIGNALGLQRPPDVRMVNPPGNHRTVPTHACQCKRWLPQQAHVPHPPRCSAIGGRRKRARNARAIAIHVCQHVSPHYRHRATEQCTNCDGPRSMRTNIHASRTGADGKQALDECMIESDLRNINVIIKHDFTTGKPIQAILH